MNVSSTGTFGRTRPWSSLESLWLALLWLCSGCGIAHIRSLREAETTFDRATEIENRERLSDAAALAELSQATTGYRLAAQMVDTLVSKKTKELREDNLLCTAYVIQAMCLWRLGEQDRAVRIAENGQDCAPQAAASAAPPREKVLLHAIPSLVRIDQANALVGNQVASESEFDRAKVEIDRALGILEESGGTLPGDHPLRAYLLLSEMAAIRVWQMGVDREHFTGQKRLDQIKAANDQAQKTWLAYRQFLACQLFRRDDLSVEKWRALFEITSPPGHVSCREETPPGGD